MATFNDFREKHIKYVHDSAWGIIAAGTEKHTNHFGFFLPNSVIDANMIEMDDFLCPELPIHGFLTIYGFFLKLQKIKEEEGGLSEEEQKLFSLTARIINNFPARKHADHEHLYYESLQKGGDADFDKTFNKVHDLYFGQLELDNGSVQLELKFDEAT